MKRFGFSYILILIFFVFSGIVSWRVYLKVYHQEDTVSIHEFPKEIDGWQSEDLPVTNDEKAILETDNVFVRKYTNAENEKVYLFVVYSQNNRKVSHPPEICYRGSGATILSSVHDSFEGFDSVSSIKVNRLLVEKGGEKQIFAYWFKVGDQFTSNYWKQQGIIAFKSLLGQKSSSALIRISTDVRDGNEEKAILRIKKFSRVVVPQLHQYLP